MWARKMYMHVWALYACLLYTSDAADERSSVDLGGRRIIKKKKTHHSGTHVRLLHTNKPRDRISRRYNDYL